MSTILHYHRGRVALHAILRALHVSAGDEVVVPAYTCAAVVEPLLRLGITPVWADIDRVTLSPVDLAGQLTERTRAVIVQHTFGYPAPFEELAVPVVEDCTHLGPGSIDAGKRGVAAFWSYGWGKPVFAGLGGTAVVHDPALAAEMQTRYAMYANPPATRELLTAGLIAAGLGVPWRLRPHCRRVTGVRPTDQEYGWRMSRTALLRLPGRVMAARRDLDVRRKVLTAYETGLDRIGVLHHPRPGPGAVPLRLPVRVFGKDSVLREAAEAGVELGGWFRTPVHPLTGDDLAAAHYRKGSCPNAEWAANHLVTLPIRSSLRPSDVDRAIRFFGRLKAKGHV
ncbi:DegT/DnrJ/EryC1/StrS family aminotransferase [Actinoplanes sp. L3-i22]|uniref:DegT/DnrJ/EryC1/StrS family aminotransferase n=1 Tax=Actinoplanes sp. L3-i22 TaxID=2836373 RepID=UPI001C78CA46|nr:DegT/DnrJ/EryC1/StrS family aminotransferase [Actinoplanes sp. L3-i22]BCY12809.1 aminotransferase DegT [Actinoplanes sp. L3-i22]